MKIDLTILDETGWTDSEGSNSDSEEEELTTEIKRILTDVRASNCNGALLDKTCQKLQKVPVVEDNHSTHLGSEMPSQALPAFLSPDLSPMKQLPA